MLASLTPWDVTDATLTLLKSWDPDGPRAPSSKCPLSRGHTEASDPNRKRKLILLAGFAPLPPSLLRRVDRVQSLPATAGLCVCLHSPSPHPRMECRVTGVADTHTHPPNQMGDRRGLTRPEARKNPVHLSINNVLISSSRLLRTEAKFVD